MKRRLHVVGLPHTTLTELNASCAYSQKVHKFCKMMLGEGCEVMLYGPDTSDTPCSEHVVITTQADRERWGFGGGFDTANQHFLWDASQPYWFEANQKAIDAIRARVDPRDYLCLIAGWAQQPIAMAVAGPKYNNPITVEWGVGYEGIFTSFCAFESYAWMHHVYGLQKTVNGRAFDTVIPNFFDTSNFIHPGHWQGAEKADYLLYMGRVVQRKGLEVAAELSKRTGRPLLVAGPGPTAWKKGRIEAPEITIEGDIEYVGEVGFEDRARLMARAYCLLAPTLYVEPFGGVAVEAMLSGTPVVASDWGSFTEIVTPEVGRRFRTLRQGVQAVEEVAALDPLKIRRHAFERYSLEAVGPQFTRWFDSLETLWGQGFYE